MRTLAGVALIAAAVATTVCGAPITPGNLLVYRVDGNGAGLSSDAAIVRVDEYDLAGNLVQTFTMPFGASGTRLTASGTATSEGKLSVSPNGEYIALIGYDAAENTLNVKSTVNRTVAVITRSNGNVDLSTTGPLAGTGADDNARSAAVDNTGNNIWIASHDSSTAERGIYYLSLGQTSPGAQLANPNSRGVRILGSQLYEWGSASGNYGVFEVGSGLPTSGPVSLTGLPGINGDSTLNTYGFFMADLDDSVPGYDTLWMARDTTGVSKYSLVGGTWTLNNTIDPGAVYHIDGIPQSGGILLAIVEGSAAGNRVMTLLDTGGYNQPMSGSFSTLASAGTYEAFRGVAFVVPEPATIGFIAVAGGAVVLLRRRVRTAHISAENAEASGSGGAAE